MEFCCRHFCRINRYLPGRLAIVSRAYSPASTMLKEEVNLDLLNSFNNDIKAGGTVPVFRRALLFPTRVAVEDESGTYTYASIYQAAVALSKEIAAELLGDTERTISYLCKNDVTHVVVQWAIWMTGNIAVPLSSLHPPDMLKYFVTDSSSDLIICTEIFEKTLRPIAEEVKKPLLIAKGQGGSVELGADAHNQGKSNTWYSNADAMLIYTSGTTSKPKGVVWSHAAWAAGLRALHAAWRARAERVLHALPLHHVHGQMNSLAATLAAGGRLQMLESWSAHAVWSALAGPAAPTLHAVPAALARLAAAHATLFPDPRTRARVRDAASRARLTAVGSAPLPAALAERWYEITGQRLLERYGMTEVGMALSNPYGEDRRVGSVGLPLPGVSARIVNDGVPLITVVADDVDPQISPETLFGSVLSTEWKMEVTRHVPDVELRGELQLKGPAVFKRYWNRAPNPADWSEGWFRTGDTASFTDGRFSILGRTNIDIIKTGGYKVSALQVESAILDHPSVADVAVLGIPHEDYEETVAALVVTEPGCSITLAGLREQAGKKLAPYQLPRTLLVVEDMPRNIMGKLDKKLIKKLYGEKLVLRTRA